MTNLISLNIERLAGISPKMVAGQPTFEDLAHTIKKELGDKIFVAHNARFDYGFVKASFKRVGIDFRPKVMCTVKLSLQVREVGTKSEFRAGWW